MGATYQLFERWMAAKGHASLRAAADALGVSKQGPTDWKKGHNASAHVVERMCKDLGEDPVPVILEAFAEAARDADAKRALQRLAKRFKGPALALALGALPLMAPSASQASTLRPDGHSSSAGVFIMRTRHRSKTAAHGFGHVLRPSRKRRRGTWKTHPPAFRCSA